MKKYLICFLATLIMFHSVAAQQYVEDINKAMLHGDVNVMSRYFGKVVDISIVNESSTYSRLQAQMVLKEFLSKNEITSFKMTNRGGKTDDIYLIGRLNSKGGNYIVFFFLKKNNNNTPPTLLEIKIERQ